MPFQWKGEEYLTVAEAAQTLEVDQRTLRRWAEPPNEGHRKKVFIDSYERRGQMVFKKEDVERLNAVTPREVKEAEDNEP